MTHKRLTRLIIAGIAAAGLAAGLLGGRAERALACPPSPCNEPVLTDKAADLFVVDIDAVPGSGLLANHQIITVSVRNGGFKPAANFKVLVSESICGGLVCVYTQLGSEMDPFLPAGQTHMYVIVAPDPHPAMTQRIITVIADSGSAVSESNESNNKQIETFIW